MDIFGSDDEDEEDIEQPVRLESNGVMTFHNGTEEAMFCHIENMKKNGYEYSADAILDIIDSYCFSRHWMMHMGPEKRSILAEAAISIPGWHESSQR